MRFAIAVFAVLAVSFAAGSTDACESYRYSAPSSAKTPRAAATAAECAKLHDAAIAELNGQFDSAVTARLKALDAQKAAESAVYRCASDSECASARETWKKSQQAVADAERRLTAAKTASSQVGTCECSASPVDAKSRPAVARKSPAPKSAPAAAAPPSAPAPSVPPAVAVAPAPVAPVPSSVPAPAPAPATPAAIAAAVPPPSPAPSSVPAPAPLPAAPVQRASVEPPSPAPPPAPVVITLDDVKSPAMPFPSCLTRKLKAAARFDDPHYFALMAADGLRALPPKLLSNRTKAATERGEMYKALFLARLLSDAVPDNRAVWGNRSALAAALGLTAEAAASGERAQTPDAKIAVPSEVLPGRIAARPATLSDWAAAMAMMADGVAQHQSDPALVAIKDSVSGIETVIPEREGGKPSAHAAAIRLEDIAPNVFVLRDPKAMFTKSVNKGQLGLMLLSLGTMAYGSYHGVAPTDGMNQIYGNSAAQAFSVPSRFKDGSYTTRTFDPAGKPLDKSMKPRTSGESEAVDLPFPLFWASGGSLQPSFFGRLANGHGKNTGTQYYDEATKDMKNVTPPDVSVPRMASLCLGSCTPPVTVQEMLLDEEDLRAIFGENASAILSKVPNLSAVRDAYTGRNAELKIAGMQRDEALSLLVGYAGGSCYEINMTPDAWIVPAPVAAPPKPR